MTGDPRDLGLAFRDRYGGDPAARDALNGLLREVFGLDPAILDVVGGWDPSYTPFSWFDADGRCVANAAAIALPLVVAGVRIEALGIQSVAVHPAWRGRGLFRDLMGRVLAWCDARARLVLLMTATPALYDRFSFRGVPEHDFAGPAPRPLPAGMARRLMPGRPDDIAFLRRMLAARAPVSAVVAVAENATMFLYKVATRDGIALHHVPDLDAVVATVTPDAETLRLIDVVAPRIPPLAGILGALGVAPSRAEVYFPPDRLGWDACARPAPGPARLMARGPFVPEGTVFMLPPTAAF
ncbi:GNAT family N-acetyltransferase [Limobrevibacterium gyesilva]|uniref:GNAT family N-acetyltransferase n=1 Tax=Limobrevibacterium gyesilva TaxID=2991712 RepID=A0AA42CGA6_9PROT|nr:GNAT family N-acetyltransferase [Limobrevibacterium gyesilva]MCW3473822.1 GNAT family N-acetyltransferase [Limobrevibacterium gyesilva]